MKRIVIGTIGVILIGICFFMLFQVRNKYPAPETLPRSEGIIHPFGDYPEEVEFEQGMTLMPGQRAIATMSIDIKTGEKTYTYAPHKGNKGIFVRGYYYPKLLHKRV